VTVTEAAGRYGVTVRQLEHWIARGYLLVERGGRGRPRHIPEVEQLVLAAIVRLLAAGFRWEVAAAVARQLIVDGNPLTLSGAVKIALSTEENPA